MFKSKILTALAVGLVTSITVAQVNVSVDAADTLFAISPYLYGRNNSTSDDPGKPTSASKWQLYNDAGITIYRENGGNNCTKYNWRKKLSSHPDWYNNVYDHDWDYEMQEIQDNTSAQALFGFQVLGKVADNKDNNFNDWAYNSSQWWSGATSNLAGGGSVNTESPLDINAGNSDLYTTDWPADSTVAILDHWLSLGLDSTRFRYWNMDNEPEIWSGTHDDVQDVLEAEEYMQRYFEVAKKARAAYPGIKLVGPAFTNEWQWYTWNNSKVYDDGDGKSYPWFEYFIKRIAEEEQATGVRLLDVLDYHFYPNSDADLTLQLHKVWFDEDWAYPNANGVKASGNSGWDNDLTNENIFGKSKSALERYMGADHTVKLGVSECGSIDDEPNVVACWYASMLGEFAANDVELLTPWDWHEGMFEVMHLFTHYYGNHSVRAGSDDEDLGAYASLSESGEELSILLVNRNQSAAKDVVVNIANYGFSSSTVPAYQLSNLPATETFKSKSDNALVSASMQVVDGKVEATLPALSVTMVQVSSLGASVAEPVVNRLQLAPNPSSGVFRLFNVGQGTTIYVYNNLGELIGQSTLNQSLEIDLHYLTAGMYNVVANSTKGDQLNARVLIR